VVQQFAPSSGLARDPVLILGADLCGVRAPAHRSTAIDRYGGVAHDAHARIAAVGNLIRPTLNLQKKTLRVVLGRFSSPPLIHQCQVSRAAAGLFSFASGGMHKRIACGRGLEIASVRVRMPVNHRSARLRSTRAGTAFKELARVGIGLA